MKTTVHLPILDPKSSLRADGSRAFVYPADVHGRFTTARRIVFGLLIALWAALPWIRIGGNPALFLDVERRSFYLFGATFNAQDIWLVFFLVSGTGFALLYVTALLGRVFCGWSCPQTVFLEGIYRPIERWVEGPRNTRMRLDQGPWTAEKVARKAAKHGLFLLASIFVAHVFLSYFVSMRGVFAMVRRSPAAHPEAFGWAAATTGFFYFNFGWFREQMCLVIFPYGRLQSMLVDEDSLVVGYDTKRGEPRGKARVTDGGSTPALTPAEQPQGDCVDCGRCVVVCPTGIDIRNGLQLDCIACTQCIDACDEVMDRMHRPRGLVRYDAQSGLAGAPRRVLRPRIYVYTALGVAGVIAASLGFHEHTDVEANVLRLQGLPYVVEGGVVRNAFEIHVVNKRGSRETLEIVPEPMPGVGFVIPTPTVTLDALAGTRVPVFVTFDQGSFTADFPIRLRVGRPGEAEKVVSAVFLGPQR